MLAPSRRGNRGRGWTCEGAPITGTTESVLLELATAGNVECTTNEINGTITENGKANDLVKVSSVSTTDLPSSALCATPFPAGPGTLTADLPWNMRLTTKGTTEVKSAVNETVGSRSEGVMFELGWGEPKKGCKFYAAAVKGKLPINEAGKLEKPLVASYKTALKLFPDSNKECGSQYNGSGKHGGPLTAAFALTSGGFPVYAYLK